MALSGNLSAAEEKQSWEIVTEIKRRSRWEEHVSTYN